MGNEIKKLYFYKLKYQHLDFNINNNIFCLDVSYDKKSALFIESSYGYNTLEHKYILCDFCKREFKNIRNSESLKYISITEISKSEIIEAKLWELIEKVFECSYGLEK